MLYHTIAGVRVYRLLSGRSEKQRSILAGNARIRIILFLIAQLLFHFGSLLPAHQKYFDLLCHIRFYFGKEEMEMGRRDDRDLMTVYEPRSKTHTHFF
jgi:hypothetical protein